METSKSCVEKKTKVVIAAGGTGGHLFPAQALAIELLKKHPNIEITFIGSGLKTNQYFKKNHFSFLNIKSGTPVKRHPWKILKALIAISQGLTKCMGYFS
ncbi:MAG: glycosyltransferase, partial [Chlamydiia bacterium]|nr:glycosyltransferase [Chlamydiia bacterium]